MSSILLLYFSKHGGTASMAEEIRMGAESEPACEVIQRCLPEVSSTTEQLCNTVPETGQPYATIDDLKHCDGLIIGSPGYFGNMSASLKYFLDQTSTLWLSGALIGKPAAVFTSTSTMHGGQESVLLSMMLPLLHHGMLISGIPYSESALFNTQSGGTPYGASHIAGSNGKKLTDDEIRACRTLGKRIAILSQKLR